MVGRSVFRGKGSRMFEGAGTEGKSQSRSLSGRGKSSRVRRVGGKALVTAVSLLLASGAASAVAAAQTAHASGPRADHGQSATSGCTDNWLGGSGSWSSSNWSAGVPNGNTPVVCITVPGSDVTVTNLDVQINALVVGGSSGAPVTLNVVSSDKTESAVGAWKDSEIGHTGVVALVSGTDARSYASTFGSRNGATLTNDGLITTSGYEDLLLPNFTNDADGTITMGATVNQSSCSCAVVNKGSITVGTGATWEYSATAFTQAGGTLSNLGTFVAQGTSFNMIAGRELHDPVELLNYSTLRDGAGAGAAAFKLLGSNSVSGVITAKQELTLLSTAATETATNLAPPKAPPALTNYGTITLEVAAAGSSNYLEHGELINRGTVNITSVGSGATLSTPVVNDKTGTLSVSGTGCVVNDPLMNRGSLILGRGSNVQLNGFSFVEASGSSLGLDIGAGGKSSTINAGSSHVTLGGTLRVTTIGHPSRGSIYTAISLSGPTLSGKFAHVVSRGAQYSVSYGAKSMTLTAE